MPFTFSIRFYEELNDLIPPSKRKKIFQHTCFGTPTIKDIIESMGVPHTEVDLILVNSNPVTFTYKPGEGDYVSVYPVFESLDISSVNRLRPEPLRDPRFIADVHLGRLARYLRLMGFDTIYRNNLEDSEIVNISANDKRIVLTRDLQILKSNKVTHGYYVRSANPEVQVKEVIRRFDLKTKVRAFYRCTECNGLIEVKTKDEVKELLQPGTLFHFDEFFQCTGCRRVYWKGSHYVRMMEWMEKVFESLKG